MISLSSTFYETDLKKQSKVDKIIHNHPATFLLAAPLTLGVGAGLIHKGIKKAIDHYHQNK
jgi:hypothetical protein